MLQSLHVRNLAVVEEVSVEFGTGLNVITGETGAGKSVIIGALTLILGERGDKSLIRAGADQCFVEAVFHLREAESINSLLNEIGLQPCEEGQLILRRQIGLSGSSKCFINDSTVTVQALKRVGDLLVDMHGPHDHQSLLNREYQRKILDAYGQLEKSRAKYQTIYRNYVELKQQLLELNSNSSDPAQQIDFIKFQIKEIEDAGIEGLDEDTLLTEYTHAAHAQRILELTGFIQQLLDDNDTSAFGALAATQKHLQDLAAIVPEANEWKQTTEEITTQVQELAHTIVGYVTKIDTDPQHLQSLEETVATVQRLKRKYGGDVPTILKFLNQSKQQLIDYETLSERTETVESEFKTAYAAVKTAGKQLSKLRHGVGQTLGDKISAELKNLGFPHGTFEISVSEIAEPGPEGVDEVEFSFVPNPGEPTRALRAIASSGEISRVMLAIKAILAAHDKIPVLVFDEVDANVGGEMGNAIGEKLRTVADTRQVLCITHLPQVAAQGAQQFVVNKMIETGRTKTSIIPVNDALRTEEIARMLGGRDLTTVTLQHASEMLRKFNEKPKKPRTPKVHAV